MTGFYEGPPRAERVEVITSAAAPLVDGGEGADRRRDVSARQLGLARREASWHRGQPALHLAQADGAGRAAAARGSAGERRAAQRPEPPPRRRQRLSGN